MISPDAYTEYCLLFYRAEWPPTSRAPVLCTDGQEVDIGSYNIRLNPPWRHSDGTPWPEVKAWAELPDPNECMADCYPEVSE